MPLKLFKMHTLSEIRSLFRKRATMEIPNDKKHTYENQHSPATTTVKDGQSILEEKQTLDSTSWLVYVGNNPFLEDEQGSSMSSRFQKYQVKHQEAFGDQISIRAPSIKPKNQECGAADVISPFSEQSPVNCQRHGGFVQNSPKPSLHSHHSTCTYTAPSQASPFLDQIEPPSGNLITKQEKQMLPIDSNCIPLELEKDSFTFEPSPAAEWTRSPTASITILRAEISRLTSLNEDANKAVEKAHHQIEEQELFVVNLQKQLKNVEADLKQHKEKLVTSEMKNSDIQEQLKEAIVNLKTKELQISDLKDQQYLKEEERREHEKEIQRQKKMVQNGDSEIASLKDDYYQLQKSLREELSKREVSANKEQRLEELVESLRKENERLKSQQEAIQSEKALLREANVDMSNKYATVQQVIAEMHAENSKLSQDLARERTKTQELSTIRERLETTLPNAPTNSMDGTQRLDIGIPVLMDRSAHSSRSSAAVSSSSVHETDSTTMRMQNSARTDTLLKWDLNNQDLNNCRSNSHYTMNAPYTTEQSILNTQRVTNQLEARLMDLSKEQNELQSEYAKMPAHAGRTIAARSRKHEVENRLETISQETSQIRLKLKYLSGNIPF